MLWEPGYYPAPGCSDGIQAVSGAPLSFSMGYYGCEIRDFAGLLATTLCLWPK